MSFPFHDVELNEVHKVTRAWHRFEDTAALAAHESSDMSLAHISVLDEARYFALARMLEVPRATHARNFARPPLTLTGLARAQILTRSEQLSLKLRSFTDVLGSGGRMAVAAETLQPWRTVVTIEPTERQQVEATAMASAHRQRRQKLAHEARQIAGKRRARPPARSRRGRGHQAGAQPIVRALALAFQSACEPARRLTRAALPPYDLTQVGGHRRGFH